MQLAVVSSHSRPLIQSCGILLNNSNGEVSYHIGLGNRSSGFNFGLEMGGDDRTIRICYSPVVASVSAAKIHVSG
jgi:hypothetical protein